MYHSGRVQSIVFENVPQSFYVLRMVLDSADDLETTIVRGTIPGFSISPGVWFGFEAEWNNHEQYGRQLAITRAPVLKESWTAESAAATLQAHGIGPAIVDRLQRHFDNELPKVLGDENKLREVNGITQFTAKHIVSKWNMIIAMFRSLEFLWDLKIPKAKLERVWSHFGDKSEEILSTNPWALVQIDGITFEQADEVAKKLNLDLNSLNRVKGGILYVCKSSKQFGHVYVDTPSLMSGLGGLGLQNGAAPVATALQECTSEKILIVDCGTKEKLTAIYEPWFHDIEKRSSQMLRERVEKASLSHPEIQNRYLGQLKSIGPKTTKAIEENPGDLKSAAGAALDECGEAMDIFLSEDQKKAARMALVEPVSVITGLPGTGKTTLLRLVVRILQDADVPFLLLAPTGIAAKRMKQVTGAEASTIHRAFHARGLDERGREATYAGIVGLAGNATGKGGEGEEWGYDDDNPHPARIVIVDESSMVDQHLLYRLLSCTATDARIVFVGDAAQLPSVGPGNVLKDLISSGKFPMVSLTKIFRQEDASDIIVAAHDIYHGDVPSCISGADSDFRFLEIANDDQVASSVLKLVQTLFDKRRNFQVLSPQHSGDLGVTALNQRIRELLNPRHPGLQEMKIGSIALREDDRIMIVRNNYDLGVFNGDTGKVVRLHRRDKQVEVKIHGPPVIHIRIPFKDISTYLRLAYCVTVHKMQGLEADTIIMPLVNGFYRQLQRNLLYTAVTRAREKVVLLGHRSAFVRAIDNAKVQSRNTLLGDRINAAFE